VGLSPDPSWPTNQTWHKYSNFTGDSAYAGICTPGKNQNFPTTWVNYETCPIEFNQVSICGSGIEKGQQRSTENLLSNADIQFGVSDFSHIG
jgi:hypothetical protein